MEPTFWSVSQVTKTSPYKQTLAVLLLAEFVPLSLSLILRYPGRWEPCFFSPWSLLRREGTLLRLCGLFMALMRMPSSLLVPSPVCLLCADSEPHLFPRHRQMYLCGVAGINFWWSLGDLELLSLVWGLGTVWMLRCDCWLQLCCLPLWLLRSPEMEISSIPKYDWVAGTWGWGRLSHGGVAHAVCEGYCHMCGQHTQGHELQGPWAVILTPDSLPPCRLMYTDKMPK